MKSSLAITTVSLVEVSIIPIVCRNRVKGDLIFTELKTFDSILFSRGKFVKSLDFFSQSTCYTFLESTTIEESEFPCCQFFFGH